MASKRGKVKTGSASFGNHHSFRPILPCGNKVLQQKWDQTYFDEHRKMVREAKSMVDTKAPEKRKHLTAKLKKQQVERERQDEIDRDNFTLLTKMQKVMHTQGNIDHRNNYQHHSLNQKQRQREVVRVVKENKQMLDRLEKVQPIYKVSDWAEDWHKKEALASRITYYPESSPDKGFDSPLTTKPNSPDTSNASEPDKKEGEEENKDGEKEDGEVKVEESN